jgi:RNA polymerase-binding protein DksA
VIQLVSVGRPPTATHPSFAIDREEGEDIMSTPVAMPRSTAPSIDPGVLNDLLHSLVAERDEQRAQLIDLQRTVDDLTGQADGESGLAREMAERSITRGLDVIADVERAIASIADGTYGRCERCEEPIAVARLEAIPYTRHCVRCPSAWR